MQFRLFAFYNQKDKAIGLADVDLASFISFPNHGKDLQHHVAFQKCFDKAATLTFEVRVREATQKGAKTARVGSSNTSSTLVPITEEESSSLNDMLADDNDRSHTIPSPKGSSSEKLSSAKDEDSQNLPQETVSGEYHRDLETYSQEVTDLKSEISYLLAKVDDLTAKD